MAILYADYPTRKQADACIQDLALDGASAPAVRLSVSENHFTVRVDLHLANLTQEAIEGVLHRHHAARVYGNPSDESPPQPIPEGIAPSTGTYQVHSPAGGVAHTIDIVSEVTSAG